MCLCDEVSSKSAGTTIEEKPVSSTSTTEKGFLKIKSALTNVKDLSQPKDAVDLSQLENVEVDPSPVEDHVLRRRLIR